MHHDAELLSVAMNSLCEVGQRNGFGLATPPRRPASREQFRIAYVRFLRRPRCRQKSQACSSARHASRTVWTWKKAVLEALLAPWDVRCLCGHVKSTCYSACERLEPTRQS